MKSLLSILFGVFLLSSCGSVQAQKSVTYRAPPDNSETSKTNTLPIKVVNPLYPRKAALNKISGWVQLEFAVDSKGHPTHIIVLDSHPTDTFVRAAVISISQWTFAVPTDNQSESLQQYIMEFKIEE